MKIFTDFLRQISLCFVLFFAFSFSSFGAEETYNYTFTSKQFVGNGNKTLGGINWMLSGTNGSYWGYDGTKGQQFGSGSSPYTSMKLSTSDIEGTITKIEINTSGASSVNASFKVSVGGVQYGTNTKLTSTATTYTFDGSSSGEIKFEYTQTSSKKAIYIKSISVTYSIQAVQKYKVTFDAGSGSCLTTELEEATITLPIATPSDECQLAGWEFAGWSETNIVANTETVVLVDNPYFPTEDKTLYAVYRQVVSSFEQIYTFTSTSINTVSSSPSLPEGASVSFNNTYSDKAQMTKGETQTWTITGLDIPLVAVSASMKTNKSAGNGSVKIKVGDDEVYKLDPYKSLYENSNQYSDKYFELTSIDKVGTIVVTINATVNSLYCQSLTITVADTEFLYSSNPNCVEIKEYIVTFGNLAIETENGKIANIPELPESCNSAYLTKVGWSSISTLGSIMDEPELVDENTFFTEDTQLYPVYSNGVKNNDWGIVTDVSEFAINDEIIIVYDNKALGAQNSNYRSAVDLDMLGKDVINIGDATIISLVKHDGGNFSFQIPSEDNVYLVAPTDDNNDLETNENIDNYAKWTISISDSVATINNVGNINRYLQYNPSNPRFTTYKESSKQQNVFFYKRKVSADVLKYYICGDITIESGEIYSVAEDLSLNTLTIKSNLDEAGEIVLDEDVVLSAGNVVVEKTIDASRYYFFSLPFKCKIADIVATDASADSLTYYDNYTIFYYDQVKAANNKGAMGSKAWVEITDTAATLKANQGYIIGYLVDEGIATIKFKSFEAQTIPAPTTTPLNIDSCTWYTDGGDSTANGWNLIGMPYYQKTTGTLAPNMVSIPNADGKTYTQIEYADANIAPFTSFFVQTKVAPTFTISAQQNAAPRLTDGRANHASQQKAVIAFADVNGAKDQATIINNQNTTADYEIGYDLVKWIGYAAIPQIYSIQGDDILAFNSLAIDNSTVIPLGVYAHADGEYTFSLDAKSVGDWQGWELYDNEEGETIRLANETLTVYLEKGKHEGRFELRLQQRVATDCDIAMSSMQTWVENGKLNIDNMPVDARVYIYDAVGRMLYVDNEVSASFSYDLPGRGVYSIVVSSAVETIAFKTIY